MYIIFVTLIPSTFLNLRTLMGLLSMVFPKYLLPLLNSLLCVYINVVVPCYFIGLMFEADPFALTCCRVCIHS